MPPAWRSSPAATPCLVQVSGVELGRSPRHRQCERPLHGALHTDHAGGNKSVAVTLNGASLGGSPYASTVLT